MSRAKSKTIKDKLRSKERKFNYEQSKYKPFEQRMAEYDTARSIIKNLCPRDPPTGEIAYTQENEGEIKTALLAGVYCVEKQGLGKKLERVWFDISPEIVDNVNYEYGEVLNRPVTPCWWR